MNSKVLQIIKDIISVTDELNNKEELDEAWHNIQQALQYLSAKDSMFKSRESLREKIKEEK